jgi:hypothetical protein
MHINSQFRLQCQQLPTVVDAYVVVMDEGALVKIKPSTRLTFIIPTVFCIFKIAYKVRIASLVYETFNKQNSLHKVKNTYIYALTF